MLQIPELLAPAGDAERLRYAINYGADAVYCGLPEFGMRSAPANFTPEQLTESVIYAHARGRKVYLTMNTLPTNEEADRLPEAIKEAAKAGVDAFIVADLGVLDACKTFAPDIDVHLSTQTGITNWAAARAAYKMGAKRVVLAREMTLQDIAILRDKTPPELEIEAFVHGAMCMSVSGRCLLSNYMAGRDANRGQCAQPCRWKYYLSEETRPGQLYEIGENENGSYILNANDLCTAPFIDLICKAGVDSLKIEGRAKTFYYVASVTVATARHWTPIWPTRQTITLNCRRRCTQSLPAPATGTTLRASISAASRPNRPPTALPISASGSSWVRWTAGKMASPTASSAANGALGIRWRHCARTDAASRLPRNGSKTKQGSGWKALLTPWKNTPCPPRSCRP